MSEADERVRIVHAANKSGCGCVGFLWRLVKGGDGWRCYRCEPVLPVRGIELLNVRHTRVALLREKLAQ
jgi:hypothetical protein